MPIPTLSVSEPKPQKKYDICPEGNYQAALVRAYYCGRHANTYEPEKPPQKKVVLVFELDEPLPDGSGNYVMSTTVTFSVHELSGLTKLLKPVMGSSYPDKPGQTLDLNELIELRVMLNVSHKVKGEKTYANIAALTRVPRVMAPFSPKLDAFCWSYDDPEDKRVPEWVRKFCSERLELGGPVEAAPAPSQPSNLEKQVANRFDATRVDENDIPF